MNDRWQVGQKVTYVDERGNRHGAEVTGVESGDRVNLRFDGGEARSVPVIDSLNWTPQGHYFEVEPPEF